MESLTNSLIAWKQFESGLSEFKEALGKDKGALKGLTGVLEYGHDITTTDDLAYDVKEVAKRLSEKIENSGIHQQVNYGFFFCFQYYYFYIYIRSFVCLFIKYLIYRNI